MQSNEEKKRQWARVVARRIREAEKLKSHVLERILEESSAREYLTGGRRRNNRYMEESGLYQLSALFYILYNRTSNKGELLSRRRKSLETIKSLIQRLEDAMKIPANLVPSRNGDDPKSTSTTSATTENATIEASATTATTTAPATIPVGATTAAVSTVAAGVAAPSAPEAAAVAIAATTATTTTKRAKAGKAAPKTATTTVATKPAGVTAEAPKTTEASIAEATAAAIAARKVANAAAAATATTQGSGAATTRTIPSAAAMTATTSETRTIPTAAGITTAEGTVTPSAVATAAATAATSVASAPVGSRKAMPTTSTNGSKSHIIFQETITSIAAATPVRPKPVAPPPKVSTSGESGPTSKESTSTFAAASAATSQLAASAGDDTAAIASQNLNSSAPSRNALSQQALNRSQSSPQTTTLSGIAPPAYQRHSDAVGVAAAAANKSTNNKKRSSPTIMDQSGSDDIAQPPTQKLKSRPSTNNPQPEGNQMQRQTSQTNSQRIPPPQKAQVNNQNSKRPSRPPPVQPVLQLDSRTEKQPASTLLCDFAADTINSRDSSSYFSGSRGHRPGVSIEIRKHWPGNQMLADAGVMLEQWEPFWKREHVIATGLTVFVGHLRWKSNPPQGPGVSNLPRTAAALDLPALTGTTFSQLQWGTTSKTNPNGDKPPKTGDLALLMYMLPITPDPKYKRANCHLWPKGTYLTVNNAPVLLHQRKQASHDPTKWEQMSYPLDLSSIIRKPNEKTTVALCSQEAARYFYMVALCSYRAPPKLLQEIMQKTMPFVYELSLEESSEKAMGYIKKNSMISIDDGDEEDGTGKLVFSLVDPITKVLMKTPVRGQRCKHWQCFDLGSFLVVNAPVSGGRWRCVCCESFVTYQELEVCGLTKEAIKTFAEEASSTRDRVEFRGDKSFHLLKEAPPRYKNRQLRRKETPAQNAKGGAVRVSSIKATTTTGAAGAKVAQQDQIEIIDLDDDDDDDDDD